MLNLQTLHRRVSQIGWSPIWITFPVFMLILVGLGILSAYDPRLSLMVAVGPLLGLSLVVWPELTLGLYANAGLFKADPRLSSLASLVDMTLALGAVLAATLAYRLVLRRERFTWSREMSLALIFASVILIGLVYTPAGSYATDKAFRFVSLTLLAFFTPLVVIRSYRSVWLFFLGWLGIATLLTMDALSRLGSGERLSGFSGTGIGMSRTVGVAVIILLFAVLMGRVSRLWQIVAAIALGLMVLAMVGTGSRGPLLMLGGAVILAFSITIAKPGQRARALLIIGILGLVVLGVFSSGLIPAASLERFNLLVNEADDDTSAQARLLVMEVAWHLFTTNPVIGRGTGSVSAFGAGQEQVYPHNILLELAAETGLVGLGLYLIVVGMVLWRLLADLSRKPGQEHLFLTLLAMLLFTLLNAMVSGDLSDNRDMWLFAGIAIAVTKIEGEIL
jgi:O-antigen ligase